MEMQKSSKVVKSNINSFKGLIILIISFTFLFFSCQSKDSSDETTGPIVGPVPGTGQIGTPPGFINNFVAEAGIGQVLLTWDPVDGAASYNIYFTETAYNPTSTVINDKTKIDEIITTASYTHTGLTAGNSYIYYIAGVNDVGEGQESMTNIAYHPSLAIPENFTATPGDGKVLLSWSPVTGASGYEVKYSTTSGSLPNSGNTIFENGATLLAGTSVTATNLTNGTAYYYVIIAKAESVFGDSSESAEISTTPQPGPNPPLNVELTSGDGQIQLQWNSSKTASSYNIYWNTSGSVTSSDTKIQDVTSPYIHTNLTNGTRYYYKVAAENSYGENPSAEFSAVADIPWDIKNLNPNLKSVHFGNNLWIAAGEDGRILTSADAGATWTIRDSGTRNEFTGIAYGANKYIAVGKNAILSTSSNGADWASSIINPDENSSFMNFHDITFGGAQFVAIYSSTVSGPLSSTDGVTWTTNDSFSSWSVSSESSLIYANEKFTYFGGFNYKYESTDGITWSLDEDNSLTFNPYDIAYGDNKYVVSGYGKIATSSDGLSWVTYDNISSGSLYAIIFGENQFISVGGTTTNGIDGDIYTSPDGISWTQRTCPVNHPLYDVAYNGTDTYIAVGNYQSIISSPDGIAWTDRTPGIPNDLNDIIKGGSIYVAVGKNGQIATSTDKINWTQRTSTTSNDLNGIAYNGSTFVVVGNSGTFLSSADGINWTLINASGDHFTKVIYSNGNFIAVANPSSGAASIFISSDGNSWENLSNNYNGVAYGNSTFVAVKDNGLIYTSTDSLSWTPGVSGTTRDLNDIVYDGSGLFVAVGNNGTILSSPDGTTWESRTSGTTNNLIAITFGDGKFVTAGASGTVSNSTDGSTWSTIDIGTSDVKDIIFDGSKYIAVGYSYVWESLDASDWTQRNLNSISASGIAFGNGKYVVAGSSGIFNTSTDLTTWSKIDISQASTHFSGIAFGSGKFVAVGDTGKLYSSTDGSTWSKVTSQTSFDLHKIIHTGTQFIAVGKTHTILTSIDGDSWSVVSTVLEMSDITDNGAGQLISVGRSGKILTSTDGRGWALRNSVTNSNLNAVFFADSKYIAVGDSGTIISSPDTVNWTAHTSSTSENLIGLSYGGGNFLAVGANGMALTSADGSTWKQRGFNYSIQSNSPYFDSADNEFILVGNNGFIGTHPVY